MSFLNNGFLPVVNSSGGASGDYATKTEVETLFQETAGRKFLVDGVARGEIFNDTRVSNPSLQEGNVASGEYSHAEEM